MNELYNKTIEVDGVIYHYDPDQDIYYRRYARDGHWQSFGWIYVTVVLAAICVYVEYLR
jgi:hypothetical protein